MAAFGSVSHSHSCLLRPLVPAQVFGGFFFCFSELSFLFDATRSCCWLTTLAQAVTVENPPQAPSAFLLKGQACMATARVLTECHILLLLRQKSLMTEQKPLAGWGTGTWSSWKAATAAHVSFPSRFYDNWYRAHRQIGLRSWPRCSKASRNDCNGKRKRFSPQVPLSATPIYTSNTSAQVNEHSSAIHIKNTYIYQAVTPAVYTHAFETYEMCGLLQIADIRFKLYFCVFLHPSW